MPKRRVVVGGRMEDLQALMAVFGGDATLREVWVAMKMAERDRRREERRARKKAGKEEGEKE